MAQPNDVARTIALQVIAAPLEQRRSVLHERCGDDASMLARVEAVLAELEDASAAKGSHEGGLRDQATVMTPTPSVAMKQANLPPEIGQFSVRRLIGTGGMGAVYEAMQDNPRRKVAIKVMKRGITSASAQRRFHLEAQLLGRLHHPGIAQIYEAGTWDDGTGGVPFFAMEYIAGAKELTQYASDKSLDTTQKLKLFASICDAVHHGHQKGIIHRDLKPGNVLVDRAGNPKVIDFGVARSTDSDLAVTTQQTDVGALIGTLQYMSPEQCEADPDIIDTRSDVYSLGVMLYELLSGKSPYDLGSMAIYDAAKVVREQPATRLSVVSPLLKGDLETIVSKAMAKDPDYRYQSAIELKQDLERYGRGDPISARPLSLSYQVSLLMRRNKPAVVAAGVVAGVLVVATALSIVFALRASSAETRALQAQALTVAELEKARVGQDFQRDILAMSSPRNAQGRTLSTQQILIEACAGIDDRFEGLPELAAETRLMVGELMFELQMFDEADRQLNNAIAAIEARQGKDDPRVIGAMAALGRLWTEQGRASEADNVSAEALVRAKRALPEDDPILIQALASRTLTLEFLTRQEEGVETAKQWLDSARRQFDEEHVVTIEAMAVCGRVLISAGALKAPSDPVEGKRMQEEGYGLVEAAAEISEAELGPKHPVTLQAEAMYVFVDWQRLGAKVAAARGSDEEEEVAHKAGEAEQRLVDVTEDLQAVLGEDHTFVLDIIRQHGRIIVIGAILGVGAADRLSVGESLLERAREGYVRRVGPDHPLSRAVEVDISQARAHRTGEDLGVEELRTAYERLLEIHEDDHLEVLRARALLAMAFLQGGQLEEGEPLARVTIEALTELVGPTHSETIGFGVLLARALIEAGQIDRALADADAMLTACRDGFEEGKEGYIGLWFAVASLYAEAEHDEEAHVLFKETADAAIEHLESTSSLRANILAGYVRTLLIVQEQPNQALEIVDEAIVSYASREDDVDEALTILLQLLRIYTLFELDHGTEAQVAFTSLLEENPDSEGTLKVIALAVKIPDLVQAMGEVMGEVMVSVAVEARGQLESGGTIQVSGRAFQPDAVIARLHHERGDLAEAVRWQERAVEVADPKQLNDAREKLDNYQTALAESIGTPEKP